VLPEGGGLYLQTMVVGPSMPAAQRLDLDALSGTPLPTREGDEWLLAMLGRQFPGSWLPFGCEQVVRCAAPSLTLRDSSNGRLDYIEMIARWNERIGARSLRKTAPWLTSREFRLAVTSGVSVNKLCFERELLDHWRLVFEKPKDGSTALTPPRP
jgi:cyclopropane-fatty-acyl-phospholipid synthase